MVTDSIQSLRSGYRGVLDHLRGLDSHAVERLRASIPPEAISDEVAQEYLAATQRKVRAHPLAQRYVREVLVESNSGELMARPLTAAWEAQAERLISMFAITQPEKTSISQELVDAAEGVGLLSDAPIRMQIIKDMELAQVYLFRWDIIKLLDNMPIPRHVIGPNLMPYPHMYWTPEHSLSVSTSPIETEEEKSYLDCDWLLQTEVLDGIRLVLPRTRRGQGHRVLNGNGFKFNKIWPDDFEYPDSMRIVLAGLAFLNSPFVEARATRLPRSTRRELKRLGQPSSDLSTNIVMLRHPQHNAGSTGRGEPISHDHQWWVSGHIRAQWYPSLKAHKLIWIAPHLKGPDDKPIREKTYVVAR